MSSRWKKGQSGNPNGRPRGSRNKSSLIKAQLGVDDAMPKLVQMFVAIANRDEKALAEFGLTPGDVTVKLMLEAGKILMVQGSSEMKALAAQVNKDAENMKNQGNQKATPTFQSVAQLPKKKA